MLIYIVYECVKRISQLLMYIVYYNIFIQLYVNKYSRVFFLFFCYCQRFPFLSPICFLALFPISTLLSFSHFLNKRQMYFSIFSIHFYYHQCHKNNDVNLPIEISLKCVTILYFIKHIILYVFLSLFLTFLLLFFSLSVSAFYLKLFRTDEGRLRLNILV